MSKLHATGFLALKGAVTVLFFYFVNRSLSHRDFGPLVGRIEPVDLAVSLFLSVVAVVAQALRWRMVLRRSGFDVSAATALSTYLWGTALAFVTPGRLGEFARGLELSRDRRLDSAAAVAVDKIFLIAVTCVFGLLAVAAHGVFDGLRAHDRLLLALVTPAVAGCAALFSLRMPFLKSGSLLYRMRSWLPGLNTRDFAAMFGLSAAAHIALLLQTALILRMYGSVGIASGFVAMSQAYALMLFLPFSIANMGVREYSFSLFLPATAAGNAAAVCLASSVTIMVMNIILPAVAGLVWAFVFGRRTETGTP